MTQVAGTRPADQDTLAAVLSRQRAHLLRQLHALTLARDDGRAAVDALLMTAAEPA